MPPRPSAGQKPTLRFTNIQPGEIVYTRLLIVEGTLGSAQSSGTLIVNSEARSGFQQHTWEINCGFFKALVPLIPGANELKFTWQIPESKLEGNETLNVTYQRSSNVPPLHLAIVAAVDSPVWQRDGCKPQAPDSMTKGDKVSRFLNRAINKLDINPGGMLAETIDEKDRAIVDAPPGPRHEALRAGGLAEVKRRVAIQAYLWQAFHAEQMRRHGMGRRSFQLDDTDSDPEPGSSNQGQRFLELLPRIHLLKSRRTLREFRDPDNAQQNPNARDGGAMHAFAAEALNDPSTPRQLHQSPVGVLILDTLYDPKMRLIRAHAAVGAGGPGHLSHGVMGSHWLWAAPSSLSSVTAAFLDTEPTNESCCVNDLNECPTAWQTLNIGSGAFFHECGHAFNNPHWPSGLMARGYVEFNRAFMTREPGCSRNRWAKGSYFAPIHSSNDDKHNHIHRAQAVRARWHPCFYIPSDPPLPYLTNHDQQTWVKWNENEPNWTSTPCGSQLKCESGIGALEIEVNGEYKTHVEWLNLPTAEQGVAMPPKETFIDAAYLCGLVGFDVTHDHSLRVRLNALACNMRQAEIDDFRQNGIARPVHVAGIDPSHRTVVKTLAYGSTDRGEDACDLIFRHEREDASRVQLTAIDIFSGAAVDGMLFHYADGTEECFGPCSGGSVHRLTVAPGDYIAKINVRAGAWIDAVEVVLRSGRSSGMRGNAAGGSLRVIEPSTSDGRLVGLFGSSGAWVISLGGYTTA